MAGARTPGHAGAPASPRALRATESSRRGRWAGRGRGPASASSTQPLQGLRRSSVHERLVGEVSAGGTPRGGPPPRANRSACSGVSGSRPPSPGCQGPRTPRRTPPRLPDARGRSRRMGAAGEVSTSALLRGHLAHRAAAALRATGDITAKGLSPGGACARAARITASGLRGIAPGGGSLPIPCSGEHPALAHRLHRRLAARLRPLRAASRPAPRQRHARPAGGAGDGLGMESPIAAGSGTRPRSPRRARSAAWTCAAGRTAVLMMRPAGPTARAVGEGIAVAAVPGRGHFRQALRAGGGRSAGTVGRGGLRIAVDE